MHTLAMSLTLLIALQQTLFPTEEEQICPSTVEITTDVGHTDLTLPQSLVLPQEVGEGRPARSEESKKQINIIVIIVLIVIVVIIVIIVIIVIVVIIVITVIIRRGTATSTSTTRCSGSRTSRGTRSTCRRVTRSSSGRSHSLLQQGPVNIFQIID